MKIYLNHQTNENKLNQIGKLKLIFHQTKSYSNLFFVFDRVTNDDEGIPSGKTFKYNYLFLCLFLDVTNGQSSPTPPPPPPPSVLSATSLLLPPPPPLPSSFSSGESDQYSPIKQQEAYCNLCERSFCNKYFLKTHFAKKHGGLNLISPSSTSIELNNNQSLSPSPPNLSNEQPLPLIVNQKLSEDYCEVRI